MELRVAEALAKARIAMRNGQLFDLVLNSPVPRVSMNKIWTLKECVNTPGSFEMTVPTVSGSHKPEAQRREHKVKDFLRGKISTLN
jgi:hypothetical protein